jgi:DNA-directed RNA polymerase specialized sigma subunit
MDASSDVKKVRVNGHTMFLRDDDVDTLHDTIGTFTEPGDVFALQRLPGAMLALSKQERLVIRLRFLRGLTHESIARRMKVKRQRVTFLEKRALQKLRAVIAKEPNRHVS